MGAMSSNSSLQAGGGGGGGGAVTVADGADTAEGTTTQTKATDGSATSWSVVQLLKGIFDWLINHAISVTPSLLTSATGTQTSVASSATSVTILASNTGRKKFIIWNDSTQILYLLFVTGGTASTTVYTIQLGAQQGYEWASQPIYTGAIIGIWASANGNARVTEFT